MVPDRALSIAEDLDYALQESRLEEFRQSLSGTTDIADAKSCHAQINGVETVLKNTTQAASKCSLM